MIHDYNTNAQPSILVIEDDLSISEVVSMVIKQEMAYSAYIAVTGQEALSFLNQHRPDLVILDYYLPDITGIELYDQLQTISGMKDIPVLLMSALSHEEEIGPRHIAVLDKPFELDDLVAKINQLLAQKSYLPI